MFAQCLRRAFRCYGVGIAAVAVPLISIGSIGFLQQEQFGPVFLVAGLGSVLIFLALGARCPQNAVSCPDCC